MRKKVKNRVQMYGIFEENASVSKKNRTFASIINEL